MPDRSERANQLIDAFERRLRASAFPKISRVDIAAGLRARQNPGLIHQGGSSLCGPAALLFNLARTSPDAYVEFAVNLFEHGKARLGKLEIKPGDDMRAYNPPRKSIHAVDWMTAASIRDSENWFFDYQSVQDELAGATMPSALEEWFSAVGFTDVRNVTNVFFNKSLENAKKASDLFDEGYVVALFIHSNMLSWPHQTDKSITQYFPEHWVVLTSTMSLSTLSVSFKVFTWGDGEFTVPASGILTADDFLDNYYGYVAAKPY